MRLALAAVVFALVQDPVDLRPKARVETEPVPNSGDAADDPAVWLHPTDPGASLIVGTDKQGSLILYSLDGKRHSTAGGGLKPNNVDVRYGFRIGDREVDLIGASVRGNEKGVMLWTIDGKTREVRPAIDRAIEVFGGHEPYGFCLYRRAKDGAMFFFVSEYDGGLEQWRLDGAGGSVKAIRARAWDGGSMFEGLVADDEYGVLYAGEEDAGIWRYGAEPEDPTDGKSRTLVAGKSGAGAIKPDVEGIAIYHTGDGGGYLIASSQGSDDFAVYRREAPNAFVGRINPVASATIDDVEDTDGIEVTNAATSAAFPKGFLVVQDGKNDRGPQNFKVYAWEDVAGDKLAVDTSWDPRKPKWRR